MLRNLWRERRGGMAVLTAASGTALVAAAALAVDVGAVHLEARRLQGGADLAALAARTVAENLGEAVVVEAEAGFYTADPARPVGDRFTPGADGANAARVRVRGEAQLFFGAAVLGRDTISLSREAVAARAEWAAFSLGTRLLSLNEGLLNAVLSSLLGGRVQLSVMDYEALARADVEVLRYVEALRARLGLEAASFEETLAADADFGDAYGALGDVLSAQGDPRAAAAAFALGKAAAQRTAALDSLLSLGPYGPQDRVHDPHGAGVAVSALDLAEATALLAGEGRQVKVELDAEVPGVARADLFLAIGERPNQSTWLALATAQETVIRTAQSRLYLKAGLGGGLLPGVEAPLLIELASAEARLTDIDCAGPASMRGVSIAAQPSLGRLALAEIDESRLDDFKRALVERPAEIADLGLIAVTAQAGVDIGGQESRTLRFSAAEIDQGVIKTAQTRDVAAATAGTLLNGLSLGVEIAGRPALLVNDAVTAPITQVLTAAAPALDGLINSLTDLLGVGLGEADVQVHGLVCRHPVLVL